MSQNEDLRKIADGVVNFCGEMRAYLEDTKESFDKVLTRHYQANHTPFAVMTFEDEAHYWEETLAEAINRAEYPDYDALDPKGLPMLMRRTYVIIRGNLKSGNTIRYDETKFNQLYINGERYTGDYTFNGETPEMYERLVIVAVQTPFDLGIKEYGNLDILIADFPIEKAEIFVNIGTYSTLQPYVEELLQTDNTESLYVRGSWHWTCTDYSFIKTLSVTESLSVMSGVTFNIPTLVNFFVPNSTSVPYVSSFSIRNIDISNSGNILTSAFKGSKIKGHLNLTNRGSIGNDAFRDCSEITSIYMGPYVTDIGAGAFSGCGKLRRLYIGDGVSTIYYQAFYRCPITELHLGRSLISIYQEVFDSVISIINLTVSKAYHCDLTNIKNSGSLDWHCFLDILENCAVYGEEGRTATIMTFRVASAVRTALTNAYNEGDETALAIYELMDSKSISITT